MSTNFNYSPFLFKENWVTTYLQLFVGFIEEMWGRGNIVMIWKEKTNLTEKWFEMLIEVFFLSFSGPPLMWKVKQKCGARGAGGLMPGPWAQWVDRPSTLVTFQKSLGETQGRKWLPIYVPEFCMKIKAECWPKGFFSFSVWLPFLLFSVESWNIVAPL